MRKRTGELIIMLPSSPSLSYGLVFHSFCRATHSHRHRRETVHTDTSFTKINVAGRERNYSYSEKVRKHIFLRSFFFINIFLLAISRHFLLCENDRRISVSKIWHTGSKKCISVPYKWLYIMRYGIRWEVGVRLAWSMHCSASEKDKSVCIYH